MGTPPKLLIASTMNSRPAAFTIRAISSIGFKMPVVVSQCTIATCVAAGSSSIRRRTVAGSCGEEKRIFHFALELRDCEKRSFTSCGGTVGRPRFPGEPGYVSTSSIDQAIHDAVEDFVARGLVPVAAGRLKCHGPALQNQDHREENHETNGSGDYRLAS